MGVGGPSSGLKPGAPPTDKDSAGAFSPFPTSPLLPPLLPPSRPPFGPPCPPLPPAHRAFSAPPRPTWSDCAHFPFSAAVRSCLPMSDHAADDAGLCLTLRPALQQLIVARRHVKHDFLLKWWVFYSLPAARYN